ncbi:MAG: histidinol-phosphate transaminase [Cyclobacteriaceae bacterium]|nr:histidinol-phosphate transaminase [Cyclobacteriaceae bacterium]
MSRINNWIRPNIRSLKPYSSARTEHQAQNALFLDANENPYETGYNRYPDPLQSELKAEISKLKNIPSENILVGNGSDEPIDMLIRVFCTPGKSNILVTDPSYGMYQVSAGINDILVKKALLNEDFSLNSTNIEEIQDENSRILFLCTPNNPTGNDLDRETIKQWIENFPGIVVVDEAYLDFSEEETWVSWVTKFDNLVVLQTLSKAWGLAGIRLGLCFANKEIIDVLNKVKPPYNIPGPSQEIALNSLRNNKVAFQEQVKEILSEKNKLISALEKNSRVMKIYPSSANFLLVKFNEAKRLYHYMIEHKMMIRDRTHEAHCENCLRITIGTPEENKQFLNLLENFR